MEIQSRQGRNDPDPGDEMTWTKVKSSHTGKICYCAGYNERSSGYGRIIAVFQNENGDKMFDVYRARPNCGRYLFPQKALVNVLDENGNPTGHKRVKRIVRVPRNQESIERRTIFLNRDGKCHGRDRRLIKKKRDSNDSST